MIYHRIDIFSTRWEKIRDNEGKINYCHSIAVYRVNLFHSRFTLLLFCSKRKGIIHEQRRRSSFARLFRWTGVERRITTSSRSRGRCTCSRERRCSGGGLSRSQLATSQMRAARAGRLSCLAGGLPKGNCVPFFGESGRFRGKSGRKGGVFLSFFFFFNLTRMKDAREYIARVKLFDAFVKFVYFFYGIWCAENFIFIRYGRYYESIFKLIY